MTLKKYWTTTYGLDASPIKMLSDKRIDFYLCADVDHVVEALQRSSDMWRNLAEENARSIAEHCEQIKTLQADLARVTAELKEARKAIGRYGQHKISCNKWGPETTADAICTCGLDGAYEGVTQPKRASWWRS